MIDASDYYAQRKPGCVWLLIWIDGFVESPQKIIDILYPINKLSAVKNISMKVLFDNHWRLTAAQPKNNYHRDSGQWLLNRDLTVWSLRILIIRNVDMRLELRCLVSISVMDNQHRMIRENDVRIEFFFWFLQCWLWVLWTCMNNENEQEC